MISQSDLHAGPRKLKKLKKVSSTYNLQVISSVPLGRQFSKKTHSYFMALAFSQNATSVKIKYLAGTAGLSEFVSADFEFCVFEESPNVLVVKFAQRSSVS